MKYLLLIVLTATVFLACKKDNDDNNREVTMANLAATYKITAATSSSFGDIYNNPLFPQCRKDDLYTLTAAGVVTIVDGPVACSPSSDATGTYSVNTPAKTITLNITGPVNGTVNVTTFTNTTLVVTQNDFMGSGFPVTVTFTRQ